MTFPDALKRWVARGELEELGRWRDCHREYSVALRGTPDVSRVLRGMRACVEDRDTLALAGPGDWLDGTGPGGPR